MTSDPTATVVHRYWTMPHATLYGVSTSPWTQDCLTTEKAETVLRVCLHHGGQCSLMTDRGPRTARPAHRRSRALAAVRRWFSRR